MARKPSDKKLISFQHVELIQGYTNDEAEIANLSSSAIIEKHILNDILPKNKEAQYWIKNLYSGVMSILDVISAVYSYYSSMAEVKEVDGKVKELVQYTLHQSVMSNFSLSGKEGEFTHLIFQMESIKEYFEYLANKTEDLLTNSNLLKEAEYMQRLINICKEEPQSFGCCSVYSLVIQNWTYLYKYGRTYRMLNDLIIMQPKYCNTAEDRMKLVEILKHITDKWTNE